MINKNIKYMVYAIKQINSCILNKRFNFWEEEMLEEGRMLRN